MFPVLLLAAAPALTHAATTFFPATSPRIRVVGRTAANGTALAFDWSSVTLLMNASGPLSIVLEESQAHGQEYLVQRTTDGKQWASTQLNTTSSTLYPLLPSGAGPTLLRVEKVTEGRQDAGGMVRFGGVHASALHPLPPPRQRRIECIGDSIMCGNHCERFSPYPKLCPGDKPVKCTTKPQPCPGHPGATFCNSDPAPGQCDKPMPHKPCPPCPPPPPQLEGQLRSMPADARESSHLSWCPVLARALDADYQASTAACNPPVLAGLHFHTDGACVVHGPLRTRLRFHNGACVVLQVECESGNGLIMTDGATCHAVGVRTTPCHPLLAGPG